MAAADAGAAVAVALDRPLPPALAPRQAARPLPRPPAWAAATVARRFPDEVPSVLHMACHVGAKRYHRRWGGCGELPFSCPISDYHFREQLFFCASALKLSHQFHLSCFPDNHKVFSKFHFLVPADIRLFHRRYFSKLK